MKNSFLGVLICTSLAFLWLTYQLQLKNFLFLPESSRLTSVNKQRSRLEFVNYTSSEWERLWLENVDKWIQPEKDVRNPAASESCRQLLVEQSRFVHDFLNLTCTTRFPPPFQDWCCFEDYSRTIYYNSSSRDNLQLTFFPPQNLLKFLEGIAIRPEPVVPTERDEHIVSKFVFRDTVTGEELVEYIEPLVAHLRFPLAGCWRERHLSRKYFLTKSYIIPPAPIIRSSRRRYGNASTTNPYHDRYFYFDAGASSWSEGAGGPSLLYFTNMWQRHGIVFDEIYAFEATTPASEFYKTVPNLFWSDRTIYQQGYVSSRLEGDTPSTPFIPKFIQDHTTIQDYVIFKLDIDSPGVEEANIEYLLDSNTNNAHLWIDELFWENHIYDNPFMRRGWYPNGLQDVNQTDPTLRGSYNAFLKMRMLGIRAHSWV